MDLRNDPFNKIPRRGSWVLFFIQSIVSMIVVPIFIVVFSLSFINFVISTLIPSKSIQRALNRISSFTLFKVMLILFGEIHTNIKPTALIENYFEEEEIPRPREGDIIISNCISYISLFWYQYMYSPLFAFPVSNDKVVCKSFFPLFGKVISGTSIYKGTRISINQALKMAHDNHQPLVLFPEGGFTNGKSIIKFFNFAQKLKFDGKFFIYGLHHNNGIISPCVSGGDLSFHLIMMLGRFGTSLTILSALPQDIPKFDNEFVENSRKIMSTILKTPLSDLDIHYKPGYDA